MAYTIEIIGLGAGDLDQMPLGIYKKLTNQASVVYMRTADHPAARQLQEEGIAFRSFDSIYEETEQFADVYQQMADTLLQTAVEQSLVYAVPGHPMLAEKTVQLLMNQDEIPVSIAGGNSYLDALFTSLEIDPADGLQFVDGLDFQRQQLDYRHHIVFAQVYDQLTAANVKLSLLEDLPHDYSVKIVHAAGSREEAIMDVQLDELDRAFMGVDNLASIYVPPVPDALLHHTFTQMRDVIRILRAPGGCSWDRAQTHESLRGYAVEEVYELLEAIDQQDDDWIVEELGDLLLQVMLHSQIGEDNGYFTADDVIRSLTDKMIHRHPQVFTDESAETEESINKTWDALKQEEKGEERTSILDGIPAGLPGLAKAFKLQKKALKAGFGWEDIRGIWAKFQEELEEVKMAVQKETTAEVEAELGDLLFVVANLARGYKINPELTLQQANRKFISRFSYIEQTLKAQGKTIGETSQAEMDLYWDQAKERE